MISRSGTLRSGAASGFAKIFREEARGPVVTAGSVVLGLERMFMGSSVQILLFVIVIARPRVTLRIVSSLRAKRSNPASFVAAGKLDCFVASLLAMTGRE